MKIIIALMCAIFSGCIVYLGLSFIYGRNIILKKRLQFVTASDSPGMEDEDKNASFNERILKPLVTRLLGYFSSLIPMSLEAQEKLAKQLLQAEIRMNPKHYNAGVLLLSLLCGVIFGLLGLLLEKPIPICVIFGLIGIYAGVVIPRFNLKRKIKRRRDEMYHQMPDVLDLLSVSVAAGLGFDQALAYVVKKSKGALSREFDIVQREIHLGRSRKEAMERMADRCESAEIQTFVSAVNQADEMGASLKNVLQIQAATIRETHKQAVEEKMQKLSVKMLIPMVLFIFPVLFIILLGPAVPSIIQGLGNLG
jgi:tight adherence protein C